MEFLCDVCDYQSNYKSNLTRHKKSKHTQNIVLEAQNITLDTQNIISNLEIENQITNKCSKCCKDFSSIRTLKYHCKSCDGKIINPLQCQYCNKYFTSRQNKSKHIKICNIKEVQTLVEEHTDINNKGQNITINIYYGDGYKEWYDSDDDIIV